MHYSIITFCIRQYMVRHTYNSTCITWSLGAVYCSYGKAFQLNFPWQSTVDIECTSYFFQLSMKHSVKWLIDLVFSGLPIHINLDNLLI